MAAPSPASGGSGGFLVMIVLSLVLVALLWIPMICLYPLTALAGALAGVGSFLVAVRLLPADGRDVAMVIGLAVGVVVVWKVYRVESRLAGHPLFRLIRHAVRLLLLGIWAIPILQLTMGATAPTTTTRYVLAVISNPRALLAFLARPQNLAIWIGALVALHFLLWKADTLREWWHHRLKWVGLRSV